MSHFRKVLVATAALGVLGLSPTVNATPIGFEYYGICVFECDSVDREVGDSVFGFLEFDDGALDDFELSGDEISFYIFEFGSLVFDDSNSSIFGFLDLDSAYNVIGGALRMVRSNEEADTFPITQNGEGFWWISDGTKPTGTGGLGDYSPISVSVPEPGTLALLGLGLLGLGFARRSRRI